jgi:hypothetical protein
MVSIFCLAASTKKPILADTQAREASYQNPSYNLRPLSILFQPVVGCKNDGNDNGLFEKL